MVYLDARHALVVRTNEVVEYTGGKLKSLGAKGPRFALCSYLAFATRELRPLASTDMGYEGQFDQAGCVSQAIALSHTPFTVIPSAMKGTTLSECHIVNQINERLCRICATSDVPCSINHYSDLDKDTY